MDVLPSLGGLAWTALRDHVTTLDVDCTPARVLDLDELLKTKQGMCPKDQMDTAVLRVAIERLRKKP